MPGRIKDCLLILVVVAFVLPVSGDPEAAPASAEQVIQHLEAAGFELERIAVGELTLYLDAALADRRASLIESVRAVDQGREVFESRMAHIAEHRDRIVRRIEQLLGGTIHSDAPIDPAKIMADFDRILRWLFTKDATFVVLPNDGLKAYLRDGGQLPHLQYDPTDDSVTVALWLKGSARTQPITPVDLVVWPAGKDQDSIEQLLQAMNSIKWVFVIHEAVEAAVVNRVVHDQTYPRWYGDGLAEALCEVITAEEFGEAAAAEYVRDTAAYQDIRDQVNLRYWCQAGVEIELPFESEERLTKARYAFAAEEIRRLIQHHGLESIARINEHATRTGPATSQQIIEAIAMVTGEDMAATLRQY